MARRKNSKRVARGLSRALERGRRTFLRYPMAGDRCEYQRLLRSSEDFHSPWNPVPEPGVDPNSTEIFRSMLEECDTETTNTTLVCRKTDGAILGRFKLSQIFRGPFQNAYLGYWVGAEFAALGFMTEGLELLLRHAFGRVGLHRIEANIIPANTPSISLAKRAGFRLEGISPRYLRIAGEWQDHQRWAVTVEDRSG